MGPWCWSTPAAPALPHSMQGHLNELVQLVQQVSGFGGSRSLQSASTARLDSCRRLNYVSRHNFLVADWTGLHVATSQSALSTTALKVLKHFPNCTSHLAKPTAGLRVLCTEMVWPSIRFLILTTSRIAADLSSISMCAADMATSVLSGRTSLYIIIMQKFCFIKQAFAECMSTIGYQYIQHAVCNGCAVGHQGLKP